MEGEREKAEKHKTKPKKEEEFNNLMLETWDAVY